MCYKTKRFADDFFLLRFKVLKDVILCTQDGQRYQHRVKKLFILQGRMKTLDIAGCQQNGRRKMEFSGIC